MNYNIEKVEEHYGLTIDAIVDQHISDSEFQGKKVFHSVQKALDSMQGSAAVLFMAKGIYYEKIEVAKADITLIGENRDETILTYDVASGTEREDGSTYGTFDSASVTIRKARFTAYHLTFENQFDYMKEYLKQDDDPSKVKNIQAVAFRTTDESDHTKLKNCRLKGYQDTLLVDNGTHYFKECRIEGVVDFIFGAGQAVFEKCDIISLDRKDTINNGFVTAASTSIHTPYGYLFEACQLRKESAKMADETVYLGRPWHPGGDPNAEASVLFYKCELDSHIKPEAWTEMGGFSPMDARLYEYNNQGAGAVANGARRNLSTQEAEAFRKYLRDCCVR
ncbi:pectinesterase [Gracilibacillus salitolerans]|uniref:Pectinesterase n=1 Tax=Gracilibacillus salitolerans TaxID=2663022 RepID=A0A5Q2TP64_9BACI|nr:pectinesterase family protein [Gracilibacillus salitolerans]QGH35907.1 pectinesterase [Gracilibacillus salitolerans]